MRIALLGARRSQRSAVIDAVMSMAVMSMVPKRHVRNEMPVLFVLHRVRSLEPSARVRMLIAPAIYLHARH